MPMRSVVPDEGQQPEEAAKLDALRSAAQEGWDDIANHRYTDVADQDLEVFVRQLGD